ncbi:diguanylate cyclase [Oleiagrimonas sp. C23AA]|uniref:sensor domain-containing diguanylate cyclase n=1 Tax=Oleiagrimonas sp. C23AA TaxID=2719047 RepID=UPI00142148BB|nr:diguanylate cyclase [Oleiagrimonas sp. C23AA]NII09357.1 diguanylate cyclase [Oleiagrimonas sp. C23AA]
MAGQRIKQRLWCAALWCWVLFAPMLAFAADATGMIGHWRPVTLGDTPSKVLTDLSAGRLQPFSPEQMQSFVDSPKGVWVVLQQPPPWTESRQTLSIRSMPFAPVTLYPHDGSAAYTNALNNFSAPEHGFDRVVFRLPADRLGNEPILLKLGGGAALPTPVSFSLDSNANFALHNQRWLTLASLCFGGMLAMAFMGLCFSLMLRDSAFAWYAGYIVAYCVLQAVQTGFLYHPLGLASLADLPLTIGNVALAIAMACSCMFMLGFCQVREHSRLAYVLILALAIYTVVVALARASGLPGVDGIAQALLNPLLIIGSLLMLLVSLFTGIRGSRSAWYFLAGWTPLLVLTAMASAQAGGAMPSLVWLNDAGIPAGAIEALILSAGLADRALTLRHDRDRARALADKDPLTGVLNRRAWILAVQQRLKQVPMRPQSLLFLDLDHFKTLNDRRGHGAGDKALIAVAEALRVELRPTDLLGRYGGEEFVVLLDGADRVNATHIAIRLRRRVHRLEIPIDAERDTKLLLTISIGVAQAREDDTIDTLVHRADTAMYTAKADGRNRVVSELELRGKVLDGPRLTGPDDDLPGSAPNRDLRATLTSLPTRTAQAGRTGNRQPASDENEA